MPYKDPKRRAEWQKGYRQRKVNVDRAELERLKLEGQRTPDIKATLKQLYDISEFNQEAFDGFMKRPYTTMPKSEGEWYLIVPKFLGLEYGWLYQSDENYNIFIINRYVSWLTPLPEDLRDEINIKVPDLDVKLHGNIAEYDPSKQDEFRRKYSGYTFKHLEPGKAQIKSTSVFDLASRLIREGILPFTPNNVQSDDLSDSRAMVELRDYQEEAWKKFLEYGAVGIYWPPGAGKMFISLYALAKLRGPKLIVVPSLTLKEEWERKTRALLPGERQREIEITTYQGASKFFNRKNPFTLIVFDEAQHLPANTYGRLSNVNAKYRLGLSATPFREDGRTDLIFALTGFPMGLDWKDYLESGIIHRPKATCYIVKDLPAKKSLSVKLVNEAKGRTIIFSDQLDLGREMSRILNVPFINGESKNRLSTIASNRISVVSRVGDEGLDITDLESVIEIGFLFGSRRQELQRFGRLLHSRYKGRYIIVMTKQEYNDYKKRLLALFEKGFEVDIKEVRS